MGQCVIMTGGYAGDSSDDCTATKSQVLEGYKAITKDSDDDAELGTMPNKGTWTNRIGVNGKAIIPAGYHNGSGYVDQAITNRGAWGTSIGVNGNITIPEGYHNGQGHVTQSIATLGGQTITPSASQQTIACSGKYMTGNIIIKRMPGRKSDYLYLWSGEIFLTSSYQKIASVTYQINYYNIGKGDTDESDGLYISRTIDNNSSGGGMSSGRIKLSLPAGNAGTIEYTFDNNFNNPNTDEPYIDGLYKVILEVYEPTPGARTYGIYGKKKNSGTTNKIRAIIDEHYLIVR